MQTVFLGTMIIGGVTSADLVSVSYIAIPLALVSGGDPGIAIALATTLGLVGTAVFNGMQIINVFWLQFADRAVERGDYKGILWAHVGGTQLTTFILRFVPAFLILYYGSGYISNITAYIPEWLITSLSVMGGMLPVVGLTAITSLLIKDMSDWVYFLIGFVALVFFDLSLIAIAIIALIIAVLTYKGLSNNQNDPGEKEDIEVVL